MAGLLTVVLGCVLFYQAGTLPPPNLSDQVGAGFFPKVWSSILIMLGAILVWTNAHLHKGRANTKKPEGVPDNPPCSFKEKYVRVCMVFTLLLAQIWIMQYVGFVISSLVFIPLCAALFGGKTLKSLVFSVVTSIFVVGGLYCFFTYGMHMPLPASI
jgi:hypothetical protein